MAESGFNADMINFMMTLQDQIKVAEFQERFCVDWNGFRQALLDVYMLDNSTRVMIKTFLEWTNKGGNSLMY